MKKLFTLLLVVAVGVGTMFAWDYEHVQIGDLYYNLDATNQTAEVTSQNSSYPYWSTTIATAIIPASVTYNSVSYSVTSIGNFAFSSCTNLISVTIPNSVTSIGWEAFHDCDGLTSVTIPNSVTSIGEGAFYNCSGLISINVASNNSNYCSVDGVLFNKDKTTLIQYPGSKQGAYTIPNSVTSIGNRAFQDCYGLTSVTIPNSVTSIGWEAFQYCSGLTSVTIPNSVTSIGDAAFSECTGLTSVTIGNSVTNIGSYAFYKCTGLTSVTIGNSVTSIGDYAFSECTGLTSVTIGNSVTSIGENAFVYCTGLKSVTIPNSVTSIGDYAFSECSSLISINVASNNSNYCSVDGVLFNKYKTTLIQYPGSKQGAYTIPNSVTSIGNYAFYDCTGLTSVTIGNGVSSIGEWAFAECTGLTSVTIPNSVTSIGDGAFSGCSGLTSITIPNSVTSIGDQAFRACTGLTSMTIPNSVTSIRWGAFADCTGLTSVTIPNSVTSIGNYAFSGCYRLTSVTNFANTPQEIGSYVFSKVDISIPLYVPAGSISAYQSADQWKDFTNILPIGAQPADVTTTTVTPSETTADIAWPQVTGAATYTIEIKKNGELICTLTFNAQGQLISIAFNAPSRNNAPQQAQAAGFSFTVTSLDSGTTYSYTMTAKGNNGNVLKTESGTFTTTGDAQGIEDVQGNNVPSTKILRNGQIFILRGEKAYTVTGQEVR